MKQIYVAYTPYHFLLSCGLAALSGSSENKYLIIIPVYSDVNVFNMLLNEWSNNPFCKIIMTNGIFNVSGKIQPIFMIRNNIKLIKNFFSTEVNEACEVFIFNDRYPEAQLLASLNHDMSGLNTYVEDGSAIYASYIAPNVHIYKKILDKFLYGFWYHHITVTGMYNYIDKVMAFQPELVRSELNGKILIKIPQSIFENLKITGLLSILLNYYGITERINAKYIIIIPNSEILNEKLSDSYLSIIRFISSVLGDGYAKYHPRETKNDFLKVNCYPHIKLIPQSLPIESIFVFLQGENEPEIIVGDISTSLLTAKSLFKNTKVISIMKFTELYDKDLEDVFKKMCVLLPLNIEDFEHLVSQNESLKFVTD
jgi:hypothetical protein